MCAITLKRPNTSSADYQQPKAGKRPRTAAFATMIMSALPDRMTAAAIPTVASPEIILMGKLANNNIKLQSASSMENFFQAPTPEEIAAYDHEAIAAIRNQDMATLKKFHSESRPLKCSNKFGESLLHMACRKGMLEVTTFLTQEAQVPFQVSDDYGRSPLHDACWAHTTNFELVDLILKDCPDLLYIRDKRGNTPLSYLKQAKWAAWSTYLSGKSAAFLAPKNPALFQ